MEIADVVDDEQDTRVFRQGRIVEHNFDERLRQMVTVVYADAENDDEKEQVRADNVCMEEQLRCSVDGAWERPKKKKARKRSKRNTY